MKCHSLSITGKSDFALVSGMRVWTGSQRPAVILGRTYELGNIFRTEEVARGELIMFSDSLIEAPASTNLNRLITAGFDAKSGTLTAPDKSDEGTILLNLLLDGFHKADIETGPDCTILREADASYFGSYSTHRARGHLMSIAPGGSFMARFGLTRRTVSVYRSEHWWHLSHWFPQQMESHDIAYSEFEVTYDSRGLICTPLGGQPS
ncbi:MAG: hypothetical protein IPM23_02655 [Candidatus Melainabacteria bacterium]|nr:hypothetical protein [Candidatus Melainabacteria bacterium]